MMRLVAPLLFGLVGAAILVGLGVWQVQRLDWKRGVLAQIDNRIAGDAVALPQIPDPSAQRYLPVALNGSIRKGEVHVLVSVKRKGAGYRVIAPFETNDGRRVLLDRGFVALEDKSGTRSMGAVQVIGNLHWPDDRNSSTPENDLAANIWFARDIPDIAKTLQTEPFLVIARTTSPADPNLTPLPVDSSGIPNDHLQYALTWFSLAAIWLAMTATLLWRMRKTKG